MADDHARAAERAETAEGKRVSWVELYLDLVFVLGVGELAHLIVAEPRLRTVWITLGLFVPLWWTWVGFAVLYNRYGEEEPGFQRVLFLAATLPAGVAAVAIEPTSKGDSTVFALSLAITRVILVIAHAREDDKRSSAGDVLRHYNARACAISALLFLVSIWVPSPWRYLLWSAAIAQESQAMLAGDRDAVREARSRHSLAALAPADPSEALDPRHFAERFGLFIIILLGEVLVEAGQAAANGHVGSSSAWAALVAALLLAATLWWAYFDAAADVDLKVLELSGGSPTIARAIFAVGHMIPAFALLITASGVGLLLHHDPPRIAYWLPCIGAGMYLAGTRGATNSPSRGLRLVSIALVVGTFFFGFWRHLVGPHTYLWLLTAWVLAATAATTVSLRRIGEALTASGPREPTASDRN